MKEIEKGAVYKRKFKIGQTIKFKYLSVLAAKEMTLLGIVKGHGDAVRKKWPIECGEAPLDTLLIWRQDHLGQTFYYAILPEDVIDIAIVKED